MTAATLAIARESGSKTVSYEVATIAADGSATAALTCEGPDPTAYAAKVRAALSTYWQAPKSAEPLLAAVLGEAPVPREVARRIGALGRAAGGPRAALFVGATTASAAATLPWELLAASEIGLPELSVIRTPAGGLKADPAPATAAPARVLFVTGPRPEVARRGEDVVAGLRAERFEVVPLTTLAGLTKAASDAPAGVVHVATAGRRTASGGFEVELADEAGGTAWRSLDALGDALAAAPSPPPIVFLDVPDAGLEGAALVERLPGAVALGWFGGVPAPHAADFALSFYGGLAARQPALDALHAFVRPEPGAPARPFRAAGVPIIWAASREALTRTLAAPAPDARAAPPRGPGLADISAVHRERTAGVEMVLQTVDAICPALLMNGRSPIELLRIKAGTGAGSAHVAVVCDTGSGSSTWRRTVDLKNGAAAFEDGDFAFPVLYELIGRGVSRRQVNLTVAVTVTRDGRASAVETTRAILYLGPTEWPNRAETWPYVPSYVLPDAEGVRAVIGRAAKRLERLGGPTFHEYQVGKPDEVDAQVQAIYEVLAKEIRVRYVPPPGSPVYVKNPREETLATARPPAEMVASGQRVRFPDDVLRDGCGTCHDLALLLAACAEHVGIYPLIVLIPGHTFAGYWRDDRAHERFWDERLADGTRERVFGDPWLLRSTSELLARVEKDEVRLVEATDVTRGQEFKDACRRGREWFDGTRRLVAAIDVWAARRLIEPLFRPWTLGLGEAAMEDRS